MTGLSLGDPAFQPLKTFAQRHALTYEKHSLARTYGAFNLAAGGKLLGYVTLVCGEVVTDESADAPAGGLVEAEGLIYFYTQYPAIKIARLAVDRRTRKAGIGTELINLSIGIATEFILPNVGCRFIIVDSKKPAIAFYERLGFTMLDTVANRERDEPVMFIDLSKL